MSTELSFVFLLLIIARAHCDAIESNEEDDSEVSITKTNKDRVYKRGELIFSDEFDSFDLEIWNHEITLGGNSEWEFQMYVNSRSNSYARDGYLYIRPTLTSDRYGVDFVYNGQLSIEGSIPVEECTSTANWGCNRSGNYPDVINPAMSAKIRTADSFYFKYGRVDVRAKIPSADWTITTVQLVPRFNVYGSDWPASGQIEIMTSRGNKNLQLSNGDKIGPDVVTSRAHFGPEYRRNGQECTLTSFESPGEGFDADFHTYSVEWTDEQIEFLIDNMTTRVIVPPNEGFWHYGCLDTSGFNSPWEAAENKRMAPFDQKFYLVLNVAAGGTNIGMWPDDLTVSSGTSKKKPWSNTRKAFLEFYESLNDWYPSWEGDSGAFIIDYIRQLYEAVHLLPQISSLLYFVWNSNYWPDKGVTVAKVENLIVRMMTNKFSFIDNDKVVYDQFKGKRYGGSMELWNPVLFIMDLDLMKQIYIKDFDYFVNRRGLELEKNDPHMHLSLINQNGESWKDVRSKVSPTFTTGKIRRMFTIFDSSSKKMVKAIREQSQTENLFEDPNSSFAKMGKKILEQMAGKKIFKLFVMVFVPKIAELLKLKITDSDADTFFSKVIVDTLDHREKTGEKRDDFLQLMLEVRQGKIAKEDESELDSHEKNAKLKDAPSKSKLVFSDDLIIAQSLLFILGGFDTVESVLSFGVYELGINPDIQEKLYEEVKAAADENDGEFSYDIINSLEYLDMFISETLRKYPPAGRTERKSTRPYKIPDSDLTLPEGSIVTIPIYQVHHDEDYWPEPSKFDPERFTKENASKRHPFAYQPFGHGPRNCIGNRFALTEVKLALAQLVLNFKLEPNKDTVIPIKFANGANIKPDDNVSLNVQLRS
ncbi:unnamed protein product [Allacma fusca]|uniref:GH16 domain-containing protein n=1 Tax=Allacma fusca TaxID=39272 RepID=A0A8J2KYL8_9HEXA|nr:unnamed protein product [Allacma fusca]